MTKPQAAAISLIAAVCDAGRNYYRKHPDATLIAVARHAAALFHGKQHQTAFLQGYSEARAQRAALAAEVERLRAALTPFARNVKAVSLNDALGHISREDLLRARAALDPQLQ